MLKATVLILLVGSLLSKDDDVSPNTSKSLEDNPNIIQQDVNQSNNDNLSLQNTVSDNHNSNLSDNQEPLLQNVISQDDGNNVQSMKNHDDDDIPVMEQNSNTISNDNIIHNETVEPIDLNYNTNSENNISELGNQNLPDDQDQVLHDVIDHDNDLMPTNDYETTDNSIMQQISHDIDLNDHVDNNNNDNSDIVNQFRQNLNSNASRYFTGMGIGVKERENRLII